LIFFVLSFAVIDQNHAV